jgi:hypothetical protein
MPPQAYSVKRTDFQKIEFMIRQGKKKVRLLAMPGLARALAVDPTSTSHAAKSSSS